MNCQKVGSESFNSQFRPSSWISNDFSHVHLDSFGKWNFHIENIQRYNGQMKCRFFEGIESRCSLSSYDYGFSTAPSLCFGRSEFYLDDSTWIGLNRRNKLGLNDCLRPSLGRYLKGMRDLRQDILQLRRHI